MARFIYATAAGDHIVLNRYYYDFRTQRTVPVPPTGIWTVPGYEHVYPYVRRDVNGASILDGSGLHHFTLFQEGWVHEDFRSFVPRIVVSLHRRTQFTTDRDSSEEDEDPMRPSS